MKRTFKMLTTLILATAFMACNGTPDNTGNETEGIKTSTTEEEHITIATINEEGDPTFVANQNTILSDWQNYLAQHVSGYEDCELNNVVINYDESTAAYYLNATGSAQGEVLRSSIKLKKSEGGSLYLAGFTLSCSTSECASDPEGCLPVGTFCTECTNKGACSKSITDSAARMFPSLEVGG